MGRKSASAWERGMHRLEKKKVHQTVGRRKASVREEKGFIGL